MGAENPADCASRGILPLELLDHTLWWEGPPWLKLDTSDWPQGTVPVETIEEEEKEICLVTLSQLKEPLIPLNHYSSFTRLQRITAWILRFVNGCRGNRNNSPTLTVDELISAQRYWIRVIQEDQFSFEITELKANCCVSSKSSLLTLHPFIDSQGLLRVGGRESKADISYQKMHPLIVHGKHPITKLIIRSEHIRMLHAGLTLLCATLSNWLHVIYLRKTARSIIRHVSLAVVSLANLRANYWVNYLWNA